MWQISELTCTRFTLPRSGFVQQQALGFNTLPDVIGFAIKDNGIGFNDKNRTSFDTLYSEHKIDIGGKGFGRFTCLKYFEDLVISSNYIDGDTKFNRSFKMGKKNDIIENEQTTPTDIVNNNDSRLRYVCFCVE